MKDFYIDAERSNHTIHCTYMIHELIKVHKNKLSKPFFENAHISLL
jgi:hypothetical protein